MDKDELIKKLYADDDKTIKEALIHIKKQGMKQTVYNIQQILDISKKKNNFNYEKVKELTDILNNS